MIGPSIDPGLPARRSATAGPMNPPPPPATGGGDPDPMPATLPVTPAARWHPEFSTVTEDAGRVTAATDLQGLADVATPGPGLGPKAMVDAVGRKFWRFEGYEYLNVANGLTLSSQNMAVFMVGRFHRVSNKCPVFSLGSVAGANPANTLGAALEASVLSRSAPMLRGYSYPRNSTYAGAEWLVAGSQMQVCGGTGRPTADGGTGLWVNDHHTTTTKPYPLANVAGAEIGRYAKSPGAAGNWGTFDLYEMIVCDTGLTEAEGDTLSAALMAHYGVVPVTNQLILEGDSIMQGTDDVTTGVAANMVLTDPGAGLIGPDWRVVNMSSSGNQVNDLKLRRDATSGWPILTLPGQNVMAVEIGRNDFGTGGRSATSHYSNFVGYLNTAGTGVLNRGWSVRVMANIASGSSFTAKIDAYRALLRQPAFLTDTGSGTGQPFAGAVSVIDTDLIMDGGDPVFATTADASDTVYYVGDSTHLNTLGTALRMTGGDDPAKGVAHGL